MDHKILAFSQLDDQGLEQLACLHKSVMRTLLADLGLPVVLRYYRIAKTDDSVIGFYSASLNGDLIGWAIGSPDPGALNVKLRTPWMWFAGQMFRLAFTHPSTLWQLGVSALSSSNQVEAHDAIELTYIGVASVARGRGVGRALLNAFVNASRVAGYRSVILSVEKENWAAVSLYRKSGFQVIGTVYEGRFERYRMELAV